MAKEEGNVHKDKISIIAFHPSGTRMVTADHSGKIAVWRGINCVSTYKKEGIVTHCIFCELNMDKKVKTNNLFFFGGKSGVVCLADDSNHCSDVCKVRFIHKIFRWVGQSKVSYFTKKKTPSL